MRSPADLDKEVVAASVKVFEGKWTFKEAVASFDGSKGMARHLKFLLHQQWDSMRTDAFKRMGLGPVSSYQKFMEEFSQGGGI